MTRRLFVCAVLVATSGAGCEEFTEARDEIYGPSGYRLEISGPDIVLVGNTARYTVTRISRDGTRTDVSNDAEVHCGSGFNADAGPVCGAIFAALTYVEATYEDLRSNRLSVTTIAATETVPPGALITRNTRSVTFRHDVGRSPCPQVIEGPTITNVSGVPLTITAASRHRLLVVGADAVVLQPGRTLTIGITFICGTETSFGSTLVISARTPDGVTQTTDVRVSGTVVRP
jgi:hypothetical protein